MGKERGRRTSAADLNHSSGADTTTKIASPATVGDVLLLVEIDLTTAARKLEWLAVTEADLAREANIVYRQAARVRARRWAAS